MGHCYINMTVFIWAQAGDGVGRLTLSNVPLSHVSSHTTTEVQAQAAMETKLRVLCTPMNPIQNWECSSSRPITMKANL